MDSSGSKTGLTPEAMAAYARDLFTRSIELKQRMLGAECETIAALATTCANALINGGKLLLCGNGGSAADAQHLAAELLIRLRPAVNRNALPALVLATDSSSLTACGNDYSFETYYARMLQALGRKGDVLIAITTSGKSPNILRALEAARSQGIATIGLLGAGGGPALPLCDQALVVPSSETGRVQEAHITAGHAMMELIEECLLARESISPAKQ